MSNVQQLKQALDNLSSKQHVISKEARYAKEQLQGNEGMQRETVVSKQQTSLLNEFNVSVQLLHKVFAKSRFDEIMGLAADPLRLILLNMLVAFFRGVAFAFGGSLVAWFAFSAWKGLI